MAILHYAYLQLKMPGFTGVLTVMGSFTKLDQCDRDFHKVSDTFGAQQKLEEIAMVTDKSIFPLVSRSESKEFDAYSGYNQIRMKEEDEEHTLFITPLRRILLQ